MNIEQLLESAITAQVSDVFVVAGMPIVFKQYGQMKRQTEEVLQPHQTEQLIREIYKTAEREIDSYLTTGDDDFSFSITKKGRFRVNAYRQRNSMAAVIRVVKFELPNPAQMHIPETIINLAQKTKGLILVTGPAGSGKSTTLACMIDKINHTKQGHIVTLEDPIEFIHKHGQSIVSQREIDIDTASYMRGLKAVLREAPDVILLGEMRDYETMQIALTAAETGQMVLSTLHTLGAANTIDRIIDGFPANQQQQIRIQLSMVLQAVVCQQLIPTSDGGVMPAFEILLVNQAIRNLIRDGKTHQIEAMIQSSVHEGMKTMDMSLVELFKQGKITKERVLMHTANVEYVQRKYNI
ncbi:MAG: type IV pilus twitching motility protein PilT [Cellulosilyticaceae bacterium]